MECKNVYKILALFHLISCGIYSQVMDYFYGFILELDSLGAYSLSLYCIRLYGHLLATEWSRLAVFCKLP